VRSTSSWDRELLSVEKRIVKRCPYFYLLEGEGRELYNEGGVRNRTGKEATFHFHPVKGGPRLCRRWEARKDRRYWLH